MPQALDRAGPSGQNERGIGGHERGKRGFQRTNVRVIAASCVERRLADTWPRHDLLAALHIPDLEVARDRSRLVMAGELFTPWELERGDETIRIEPKGPLIVSIGGAMDLAVDMAVAGAGIIGLFEEWLQPHIAAGRLVPVLPEWWTSFPGPFLYYSGRRLVPPPLRAFVDFVRSAQHR